MWKSWKPEEQKKPFVSQKVELPVSVVEEKPPVEVRFERNPTLVKEKPINVGKSISIKGELIGDEDFTVEGQVEGQIILRDHHLVIGPNGLIKGEILAKNLTVNGRVVGNIITEQLTEINASGSVVGDIESSRISIVDGGYLKGNVDIRRISGKREVQQSSEPEIAKVDTEQNVLAELHAI